MLYKVILYYIYTIHAHIHINNVIIKNFLLNSPLIIIII